MTPFGRCSNELKELCNIEVSAKTVERVSESIGRNIQKEVESVEKHILSGHADLPEAAPDRLYVTTDGVTVPIGKGYRECKVGAVCEAVVSSDGEITARNVEHVATMGNCEAIGDRLYALAFRRGVESAKEIVALADGGRWIWKQVKNNFPGCVEILDFYHAGEHLAEVTRSWHGTETPKAAKWLEERKADLLDGRWRKAMRSIQAWRPTDAEAAKERKPYLLRTEQGTDAL